MKKKKRYSLDKEVKEVNLLLNNSSETACGPTCDLGFDLALHLQRVHEDAAVADEASAGDASVRLAETLLLKILPVQHERENQQVNHGVVRRAAARGQCTPLWGENTIPIVVLTAVRKKEKGEKKKSNCPLLVG